MSSDTSPTPYLLSLCPELSSEDRDSRLKPLDADTPHPLTSQSDCYPSSIALLSRPSLVCYSRVHQIPIGLHVPITAFLA